MFKKLYKNSAHVIGTLQYFRKKLQRRNVTVDVKHFEDCEQLFISVGRCYTVEALLTLFNMFTLKDQPRSNGFSNSMLEDENLKKAYWDQTLDKFVKEYLLPDVETPNGARFFITKRGEHRYRHGKEPCDAVAQVLLFT